MNYLVTGSSGFVGRAMCEYLFSRGLSAIPSSRFPGLLPNDGLVLDFESNKHGIAKTLMNVDVVIHVAGRAHVMHDRSSDPLKSFRLANVCLTKRLAELSVTAGVRRFVFISSIKVNGESANLEAPFSPYDVPNPQDPYAFSKAEAESVLLGISRQNEMEVVIVRPPLVYGPGVKGNFRILMKLLQSGVPLPFKSLGSNLRSYVSLANLVDFISVCCDHPAAANRIFTISDQHDVSTAELITRLGLAMERPATLFSVHKSLLALVSAVRPIDNIYTKLCDSLVVDSSAASNVLGWTPPLSLDNGLKTASF